ncbi:zinc-binding alcohol dehydrogenase family protein [Novosphingobium sp. fls2-241-R2A-195]|jgi:2-desacetyl-2-hydroxyethyl bacteriochlorophyllide A dehydrogenase|uniref:zinc-binding alcohol dehydrogenase family protein n=1 Tax=Novosphingobium sp. fls2-241-R2A-195 TaxID=3040296 RepID=UPI00254BFAB0|nr:zinc-binding alcohol dehydrogenase family protein [Novosphingobium sp. fls2-241-R2A-195]
MPVPAAGEALVRIRRVGICGTDYHIVRGTQPYLSYPRVPGHELAAEIVSAGVGSEWQPGLRVCIMPYHSCGACIACRGGKPNCCAAMSVLGVHKDGGLAEYLAIDERYLIDAEGLSLDEIAMVEFLSIGRHAVRRAVLQVGERVLVVGAGPIGMATAFFAARGGADVTVLDGNESRVALCVDKLGAHHGEALGADTAERLAALTNGEFFDCVFDATGNAPAIEAGFAYVAHGGRYVLVSIVTADIRFSDPEFHKREMSLIGSRNATHQDFADVIEVLRARAFPLGAVVSHTLPFAEVPAAIGRLMEPDSGVIKALVVL